MVLWKSKENEFTWNKKTLGERKSSKSHGKLGDTCKEGNTMSPIERNLHWSVCFRKTMEHGVEGNSK
ncbi:hypothetical protein ScPMuIL_009716 [Solemya velum]